MKFYLGTHQVCWLARMTVPLFVSRRRLAPRKHLPRAIGTWSLDSGGFTELSTYGRWTIGASAYVTEVRRYRDEIGGMEWAAPQDWMCEPWICQKTGLSIAEHQRRTVDNYLELKALAPDLPFIPVLQGWQPADYLACWEMYERAGVLLRNLRLVGLGSVCRRSKEKEGAAIVAALADQGLRLHGFGFKLSGLRLCGERLASADSLAWSYNARRNPPLDGCAHKSCANCPKWAVEWRQRVLAALPQQQGLFVGSRHA